MDEFCSRDEPTIESILARLKHKKTDSSLKSETSQVMGRKVFWIKFTIHTFLNSSRKIITFEVDH